MSDQGSAPGAPSAGTLLRQAREAAGIHFEVLAGTLKVPPRQIEALEQDRVDLLPDVVFARALTRSICRQLGIDPAPVLAAMPQERPLLSPDTEGLNQPFRASGAVSTPAWREWLARPPVLLAVALLVGALVLFILPPWLQGRRDAGGPQPAASAPAASPSAAAPAPASPASDMVVESVTPPGIAAPAVSPAAPAAPAASSRNP